MPVGEDKPVDVLDPAADQRNVEKAVVGAALWGQIKFATIDACVIDYHIRYTPFVPAFPINENFHPESAFAEHCPQSRQCVDNIGMDQAPQYGLL